MKSREDLLDGAALPLDPNSSGGLIPDPTAQIVPTVDIQETADVALPFTEEQITCLTAELGADEITNLLGGGVPDFSLFAALDKCGIDLMSLLAP